MCSPHTGSANFLTPASHVLLCLQDLNALPFAAMAINCASWVFYALLYKDYYIYFGNLSGMLMGMFYVLICYKFSKEAVSHSGCRWCCQLSGGQ
jgi:hypothetical protein